MNRTSMRWGQSVGRKIAIIPVFAVLSALLMMGAAQVCLAKRADQKTFATAQKATHALFLAIQNNDKPAITAILGAHKRIVCANDAVQARREHARFVSKYQEMHRLVQEPDGKTMLYIGAENWPFPFPLVSTRGVWRFDAAAGTREIMFRRIGENEIMAIQTCQELVLPKGPDATLSSKGSELRHGYYFRSLTPRGHASPPDTTTVASKLRTPARLAFVAYPAAYRSSGVMTFLVNQDGAVYAKDLGPHANRHRQTLSGMHPDSTWTLEK